MASPSPLLIQSLEKRPLAASGLVTNDHPIPRQLAEWQARGGFWGKVSAYYVRKHNGMAGVYTSPFTKMDEGQSTWGGKDNGLADGYYEGLDFVGQRRVDEIRGGMRRRP